MPFCLKWQTFISNFVKIGQMVQNSKERDTSRPTHGNIISLKISLKKES